MLVAVGHEPEIVWACLVSSSVRSMLVAPVALEVNRGGLAQEAIVAVHSLLHKRRGGARAASTADDSSKAAGAEPRAVTNAWSGQCELDIH